jgi:hypothetical protein
MEPTDDPELRELLKEWPVSGAPPSLDARVLGPRQRRWSYLLTGSIRVPVPVGLAITAILFVLAGVLVQDRTEPPPASSVSLMDYRPVKDLNVRVIRGHEAN